jgi:hypothetical protein
MQETKNNGQVLPLPITQDTRSNDDAVPSMEDFMGIRAQTMGSLAALKSIFSRNATGVPTVHGRLTPNAMISLAVVDRKLDSLAGQWERPIHGRQ